jgi:hypothetical protein
LIFLGVFLVDPDLILKLSSTKTVTRCWTSSLSWIGVGADISARIADCGLRRVFKGSNGDNAADCERSSDMLRRRLDIGRDEWSKKTKDLIMKIKKNFVYQEME